MTVMSPEDALLAHVVSNIESNVQFLISHNYISQNDAATLLSKLSTVKSGGPATSSLGKAKALWAYNENGAVSIHLLVTSY